MDAASIADQDRVDLHHRDDQVQPESTAERKGHAAPRTGDGRPTNVPLGLLPHHHVELQASGINDETIKAAGIYSETSAAKLAIRLNRKTVPQRQCPALVYPFVRADGSNGFCRVKFDHPRKGGGKYDSPVGQPADVYLPPGVAPKLAEPTQEIIITEGEKKSLLLAQLGFTAIGLVGVHGWKPKGKETLLAVLEHIVWTGRPVYICFDSDLADNEQVRDAAARLAAQLTARGAKVKIIVLPPGPPGADGKPTKSGIDDHLVREADPRKEMRRLIDAGEEPTPVDAGMHRQHAKDIDPASEAERMLTSDEADGLPRLRYWRGTFWRWSVGRYVELHKDDARGAAIRYLNRGYYQLGTQQTANVIDQLKAQSAIAFRTEPPTWIGDKPGPWPADEVLAAPNGIIHLPSLIAGSACFAPATPRLFVTTALDYPFSPDAPEPAAWLSFLRQLWADDPQSIMTLQEWFGLSLTADTRHQKILLVVGPKRSGKGTLMRVLRGLVGPSNTAGPTLASLATNFGLWPLLGKSLAIINDARLSGRSDQAIVVERLLSISGEDDQTVDRKNLEPVTCKIPARLVIVSNELPRLHDSSGALAGRMIVLRLTQSFYGREDHDLTTKLLGERPAILLWAIAGWARLRERGRFTQPQTASELVREMEDISSPVGMFLRERCQIGPYRVAVDDLFAEWCKWCDSKGRKEHGTHSTFGRDLRAVLPSLEISRPKEGGERYRAYEGVGLVGAN